MTSDAPIARIIAANGVVLYMMGTSRFPQCGFLATVAAILAQIGIPFKGVNVLEDEEIRQGVKPFSDWPTIPQLHVKGEFVGGFDIVRGMYRTGERHELLKDEAMLPHD